jgi:hypothetical protein
MSGRDQSESLVAIIRCAQAKSEHAELIKVLSRLEAGDVLMGYRNSVSIAGAGTTAIDQHCATECPFGSGEIPGIEQRLAAAASQLHHRECPGSENNNPGRCAHAGVVECYARRET